MGPTAELIAKILAVAADERGDPNMREIALRKLEALYQSHPHLFPALPPKEPLEEPAWTDVPEVEGAPPPQPPGVPAWFMDEDGWSETSNGNISRVVTRKSNGASFRVVVFHHKKTPTCGWLIIDLETEDRKFSRNHFRTEDEARENAWKNLP